MSDELLFLRHGCKEKFRRSKRTRRTLVDSSNDDDDGLVISSSVGNNKNKNNNNNNNNNNNKNNNKNKEQDGGSNDLEWNQRQRRSKRVKVSPFDDHHNVKNSTTAGSFPYSRKSSLPPKLRRQEGERDQKSQRRQNHRSTDSRKRRRHGTTTSTAKDDEDDKSMSSNTVAAAPMDKNDERTTTALSSDTHKPALVGKTATTSSVSSSDSEDEDFVEIAKQLELENRKNNNKENNRKPDALQCTASAGTVESPTTCTTDTSRVNQSTCESHNLNKSSPLCDPYSSCNNTIIDIERDGDNSNALLEETMPVALKPLINKIVSKQGIERNIASAKYNNKDSDNDNDNGMDIRDKNYYDENENINGNDEIENKSENNNKNKYSKNASENDSNSSDDDDEDLVEVSIMLENSSKLQPLSYLRVNDDDYSDSDEDLVEIARGLEEEERQEKEKKHQQEKEEKEKEKEKEKENNQKESDEEAMEEECVYTTSSPRSSPATPNEELGEEREEDEVDSCNKTKRKMRTKTTWTRRSQSERRTIRRRLNLDDNKARRTSPMYQTPSPPIIDNSVQERTGRSTTHSIESSGQKEKAMAKNPITFLKQQNLLEEQSPFLNTNKTLFSDNNCNNDALWSDSDKDNSSDNQENKKKGKNVTKKKNAQDSTRTKKTQMENTRRRKHSTGMTEDSSEISGRDAIFAGLRSDDKDSYDEYDGPNNKSITDGINYELDRQQLHPNLEKPRFGPFPLEPFVLSTATDNCSDDDEEENEQVPASLNRYLLPYQREGIQFLHKAVSEQRGAILGDEMGLGKTVQIIALLAALLQKTGTRIDMRELDQRKRSIEMRQRRRREKEEQALLLGKQITPEQEEAPLFKKHKWVPILVIVPPTTFSNWLDEFKMWGHFCVATYQGNKREKALEQIEDGSAEILLTAKSLFTRSSDFRSLNSVNWKLVIIDEFHLFKNPDGVHSEHLRTLKGKHWSVVLGMTGTLMQNDHKELWNLIDLVDTNYLGTWKQFQSEISIPIKLGRTKTAAPDAIRRSEKKHKELVQRLKPLFIGRTKADVLDDKLPEKDERVIFCQLSDIQKSLYEHILKLPDYELLRKANGPCDCGVNQAFFVEYGKLRTPAERIDYQRKHRGQVRQRKECCYTIPSMNSGSSHPVNQDAVLWRSNERHDDGCHPCQKCPFCILFPAMQKLYKLSSHAGLLQLTEKPENHAEGSKVRESANWDLEFAKVAIPKHILEQMPGKSYIREDTIMDNHTQLSGKIKVLDGLLKKYEGNNNDDDGGGGGSCRVLIFSASTQTLDLIQNYVRSKGYTYLRMDGSTPSSKRQELADQFKKDPSIFLFLLSTKAMGLGLNLTEANKVIIFDVEWNPSWDVQAQDRAYRIGQDRDVQVIRLVARGTIDELKYIRQVYKLQLKQETIGEFNESAPRSARIFRGVAGDKNRKGEIFGTENLLKFKDGSFMKDLWKSSVGGGGGGRSNSDSRGSLDNALHNTSDVVKTVQAMTDDDVDNVLLGNFNEFDQVAKEMVLNSQLSEAASSLPNCTTPAVGAVVLEETKNNTVSTTKPTATTTNLSSTSKDTSLMHHMDFFSEDRGGAALKEGDDGFNLEMGGASQVIHDIYEQAEVGLDSSNVVGDDYNDVDSNTNERDTTKKNSRMGTISEEISDFDSDGDDEVDPTKSMVNPDKKRTSGSSVMVCEGGKLIAAQQRSSCNKKNSASKSLLKSDNNNKNRKSHSSHSYNNNNITLFGMSSSKLEQKKGKTTFSALDLHLPSPPPKRT